METKNQSSDASNLVDSGFLLPPVLEAEDIAKALGLPSRLAVLRLHKRDGLPLARIGHRFYCTRAAFNRWLDERCAEGADDDS